MKAKSDIEKRLRRLRERYLRQYLRRHFERRPEACAHNHGHRPNLLPYRTSDVETELEVAPRKVTTLLVLNDRHDSVRVCLLGLEDPETWEGDVCETAERAGRCPHFKPRLTLDEATRDFDALMADDRKVLKLYPDVAMLQWVLGVRMAKVRRGLMEWLRGLIFRRKMRELPPASQDEPPDPELEALWR